MQNKGKIISIKGQVVEVEFEGVAPNIHDIFIMEEDPDARMEVYASASSNSFYCLSLTNIRRLYRGAITINTGEPLKIPVGEGILGRVIDLFGEVQDKQKGPLMVSETKNIFSRYA